MQTHDRLAWLRRLSDDSREQAQSMKEGIGVRPQGAIQRALQFSRKISALLHVLLQPLQVLKRAGFLRRGWYWPVPTASAELDPACWR